MSRIIDWEMCKKQFVKNVDADEGRIISIVEKALMRKKRAESTSSEMMSLIFEDYYETIKELLVAYLLKNGLRSGNHQCMISYFYKQNPDMEKEAVLISEMCFYRNRLNYYGEDVPLSFYEKNKEEIEKIIKLILNLINREVKNGRTNKTKY